jgi:hypothetical protein
MCAFGGAVRSTVRRLRLVQVIVAGGPGAAGTVSVYKQRLAGY